MRILLINTFHYPRGGASIYVLALSKLLRERGHEVFHFAMKHPKSLPCAESEYWPGNIEFPELLAEGGVRNAIRVLRRTIRSKEAERCISKLIADLGQFDIAHVHNIMHHLTPSIFKPLRKANIPIIWTLHDYSLICPNTSFFDQNRGIVCTKCLKGGPRFIWAPIKRCKKSSFRASLIAAVEAWAHRINRIPKIPDLFIAPSQFLADRLVDAGLDQNKIKVVPNFGPVPVERPKAGARLTRDRAAGKHSYALYAGRLAPGKGLQTLVEAWRRAPRGAILRIAGTGPLSSDLKSRAGDSPNIEFSGFIRPEELAKIRCEAEFLILPSELWENAPLAVLEAFSDGIPVLASDIGGIPELVRHGKTGLLFEAGNPIDLRDKATRLWSDPDFARELGQNAHRVAETEYSPERHVERIEAVYERLVR